MISAYVKLILACFGYRCGRVNRDTVYAIGWIRNPFDNSRADWIPAILRDDPLARRILTEFRTSRRERVNDLRAEQSFFFIRGRNQTHTRHAFALAQAFVIGEPEGVVLDQRSAYRGAVLIAFAHRP